MANFVLSFDHAQPRRDGLRDRLGVTMAGRGLESIYFSSAWIDPVTNSGFLRPAPMDTAFFTSNAGIYAKQTLSGLDKNGGHAWREIERFPGAGKVCQTAQAGDWIRTSSALGANRAVCVGFHHYTGGDDFTTLRMGWGTTTDTTNGVVIEIYSGGKAGIFKDGAAVSVVDLDLRPNEWNSLMLIPCRHRELLLVLNGLGGARVVFEDITEAASSPVITPAEKFWVKNVAGSADVQLFPMKWASSGYLTSDITAFPEPPGASDSLETYTNPSWLGGAGQSFRIIGHPSYAGTVSASAALRNTTDAAAFTANGTNIQTRIRVTMTGDGNYSPAIYGAHLAYAGVNATTNATEQFDDLLRYCQNVNLSVGDDDQGQQITFTLRRTNTVEADVTNLDEITNRPIKLALGSVKLFDGTADPTGLTKPLGDDTIRVLDFEARDYLGILETYIFDHRVPLDGWSWIDAVKFVVGASGWAAADMNITDPGVTISSIPGPDANEFGTVIEPGDTALKWLRQLMEDYAAMWEYGFRPTATKVEFYALSQAAIGTTADVVLYKTIQDAITTGGYSAATAFEWVYSDYTDDANPPEGNIVRVTGYDPRGQRPIQSYKIDSASITVTTAPSSRPANWLGVPRRVALASPALNTQDEVDAATNEIYDRVSGSTYYASVTTRCPLMGTAPNQFPLWRSRNVELQGLGVYRVVGLSMTIESEIGTTNYYRTTIYSLRYLTG